MLICNDKLKTFINRVDDISRVNRSITEVETKDKNANLVTASIRKGYYSREKFRFDTEELIDKTIKVEDIGTAKTRYVKVNTAKHINEDIISLNNGEYIVRENGLTTDGAKALSMGSDSAIDKQVKGLDLLNGVAGTMVSVLDKLVSDIKKADHEMEALSPKHEAHLDGLFKMYKDVLLDASKDIDLDVKVFLDLDEKKTNRGYAEPETGRMNLVLGAQQHVGITEVLAEELQHILISDAFKRNPSIAKQVMDLRTALAEAFDYRVFLIGIIDPTEEDISIAKDKFEYAFHNPKYPLEEFLAKITTNSQLVEALGTVTGKTRLQWLKPIKPFNGKRLSKWARLYNTIIPVLNSMYWGTKLGKESARELSLNLMDAIMRAEHKSSVIEEESIYSKTLGKIDELDDRVAKITGNIKEEHKSYSEYLASKEEGAIDKAIKSLWRVKILSRAKSLALQNGLFTNVLMNTTNPDVVKMYEMFRHSKEFVNREVVALKKTTGKVLGTTYKLNDMSVGKRRASKRVLIDTDANVLGKSKDILAYLEDESKINSDYNELTKGLNRGTIIAIEELADLLVTNKTRRRNGYVNAAEISLLEEGVLKPELVVRIDKAVSLLALKNSSEVNKKLTIEAIKENPKAIDHALILKTKDEAELLDKAYGNDLMYTVKGAKQEHYIGNKKHYLVEYDEMKELTKAGLHNIGKHKELSRILGKNIFMVIGDNVDAGFTEGLISKVQLKNEGDSLKRLIMNFNDLTEEEADLYIKKLSKEKGVVEEALIPERSGTGAIYDYKVRIPHEAKNKYLGLEDDLIHTIAGTVSNLTHKQEAMRSNRAAIKYLAKFYEEYKSNKEFKFIDVSEDSENKLGREYWETLPHYLKKDILKKHKDGKLMVEESLLVHTFGYQDVSISNAPWIKDRVKRQLVVKKMETVVKELVAKWKQVIVTLTPSTIKGNVISNMLVALHHTKNKNPLKYMKKYQMYWEMINEYQEDNSKMRELKLRKDAGEDIPENSIKNLQAKLDASFVQHIMMDGQYSSMLEDIDTEYFEKEGYLEGKVNSLLSRPKNAKTRENLKAIVNNIYIRKDSKMFNPVMKLTLYSDAINKLIMLEDMAERNDGKVTQDMLNYVDMLHVNYGYLDNRYLKWGNETFMTFTKYTLRILPAIVKMTKKKPVSMFMFESLNHLTGANLATPTEQYYNPFETFSRKFDLWADPIDVFRTILVPPWIK